MIKKIIFPANPLVRKYVRYFWAVLKEPTNDIPVSVPVPYHDLILSFDSHPGYQKEEFTKEIKGCFFSLITTKSARIVNCDTIHFLGARFYPEKLYPLLGIPMNEMPDNLFELDLLSGINFTDIVEIVWEGVELEEKVSLFENEIFKLILENNGGFPPLAEKAVMIINQNNGLIEISDLCNNLNLYYKKLEREFDICIGISPKSFTKLVRFHNILYQVKENNGMNTDIIYNNGYYDQAHFIKDCQKYLGTTFNNFLKRKNPSRGITIPV